MVWKQALVSTSRETVSVHKMKLTSELRARGARLTTTTTATATTTPPRPPPPPTPLPRPAHTTPTTLKGIPKRHTDLHEASLYLQRHYGTRSPSAAPQHSLWRQPAYCVPPTCIIFPSQSRDHYAAL
ncbi:hypothetical protein E2C01_015773 [Portunus trituberculatus]|uniref:Uncharacterized protein n=1 Tax=Portunus trituberculatus TaxID=210409 RepID=A0A5B7DME7_PORTR|nr:hypothetical protein [Portunus trituberculatus]